MIPSVLSETKAKVIQALNADPRRYRKFADVRYDCVNGSTINYHDDVQSFSASIDSHPPETSLMFPDPSNNTDVFEVLETFLNNTSIPKCGSTALILVKRYTKINRGFRMASTLQQEHITVHFIQSNYMPYGGNLGSTNNVAGRTGGVYVLTGRNLRLNDATFPAVTEKVMGVPYLDTLIYGHYLDRSQNNSTDTELEPLHVPNCQRDMVNVTLFIATDIVKGYSSYFFQSINLTLVDQTSNQRTLLSYDQSDYFNDSDSIWKSIQLKSGTSYKIFMTYRTSFGGRLQIRMYIDQSVYGTESDSQS